MTMRKAIKRKPLNAFFFTKRYFFAKKSPYSKNSTIEALKSLKKTYKL